MPTKSKSKTKPKTRRPAARKPASKPARKAARKAAAKRAADRRSKQAPESLRLRAASPSLTVNDVEKSVAFYKDVLGFHVKERWVEQGKLMGAELVAGLIGFFVSQDDWKKGRDRSKGEGFRMHCTTVQDVDELAAMIRARGGTLLQEPKSQSWGTRDFAVADPDGFKITFSSPTK